VELIERQQSFSMSFVGIYSSKTLYRICIVSTGHHMCNSCPLELYMQRPTQQPEGGSIGKITTAVYLSVGFLHVGKGVLFIDMELLTFLLSAHLHRNMPSFSRKNSACTLPFPRTPNLSPGCVTNPELSKKTSLRRCKWVFRIFYMYYVVIQDRKKGPMLLKIFTF
jgi:hypothetical protein